MRFEPMTLSLVTLLAAAPMIAAGEAEPNLRRTFVVKVFEANRQSVVNINTTQIVRQRFGLFGDDPTSAISSRQASSAM